jgi:dimethylglycine oxidase
MTARATTVIVGAGIVGAATAYHLALLGHDDILVVDQGDIPHNPGSTSHAPGGVVAMSHNRLLARMSFYSTGLYRGLEPFDDRRHTHNPVGSIELARTSERMEDLVREQGESLAFGAHTRLLDSAEVVEMVPYLDAGPVAGGLFIPDSAIISGVNVTGALLRDACATGRVRVRPRTEVVDVEGNDRVAAVITALGERIETDRVVLCTNIWALPLRRRIQALPLMAYQHQYVETGPVLDGFDPGDPDHEVTVPTVRDLDVALYYRHHWDRLGVGSYHHVPLPVAPETVGDSADRPFTPEHLGPAWEAAREVLPALPEIPELTRTLNGMFAFSVDGMPIIGQTALPGLWMAVASWITHAGGVGKSVAELIDSGDSEWDLREASIDRFHPHQTTGWFIEKVGNKNYREVYEIHHPREPPSEPRGLRLSPFQARLDEHKPEYRPFGGIELPAWYGTNRSLLERYRDRIPGRSEWASRHWSPICGAEHLAVRDGSGLFDLTGLSILEVHGPEAAEFVGYLCSGGMDVAPGRVVYTTWLTPAGGVKRDLTVARLEEDRYWMFVGEGTRPQDLAWAKSHAGDRQMTITDISDAYTALGLWGPDARSVLDRVIGAPLGLGYFQGAWIEIGPVPAYAMRISYVGEGGYELHFPVDQSLVAFDRLWSVATETGTILAGSMAMDSLRLEKGYRLWGVDVHTEHDPHSAGLGWTLRADGSFVGAGAAARRRSGMGSVLVCLRLDGGDPLGNEPVLSAGRPVGYVTSAAYGYAVGAGLAFAWVEPGTASEGAVLTVLVEGVEYAGRVVEDPVWDPSGSRLRA